MRRVLYLAALLALAGAGRAAADTVTPLLQFSKGALPNDTTPEGEVKLSLEPQADLGGTALKAVLPADGSFGQSRLLQDWSGEGRLLFTAVNPSQKEIPLMLTVKHAGSTTYANRVDTPFTLKPGKNEVSFDLAGLANTDGSRPDLAHVKQWYVHSPGAPATAYFGDVTLVRRAGPTPAAPLESTAPAASAGPGAAAAMPAAGPAPAGAIRITGTLGDIPIDLTITGVSLSVAGAGPAGASTLAAPAARARTPILEFSKGQMPNDTSPDELMAQLTLEEKPELGGRALKVTFPAGASWGRKNGPPDWSGFRVMRFQALNPGQAPLTLALSIRHAASTDFQTRVEFPITLQPGVNNITVPLDTVRNVNGSAPQWSAIRHWYLSCEAGGTAYFGDVTLDTK